jgi:hypothetical protein
MGVVPADAPAEMDTVASSAPGRDRPAAGCATPAVAAVVGAALAGAAGTSAVALLVAVAVLQGLAGWSWLAVADVPGRAGGAVVTALAATAADVCASVWPHGRLGTLVAVVGLTVPVLFVHQLSRGAARMRVVASLGGIAVAVVSVVGAAALLQVRHEFPADGASAAVALIAAAAAALLVCSVAGRVAPALSAQRFDLSPALGMALTLVAAAAGALAAGLVLAGSSAFSGARGAVLGAVTGLLVGLLALAAGCASGPTADAPVRDDSHQRRTARLRPLLEVSLPIAIMAPVGLLLCLALAA